MALRQAGLIFRKEGAINFTIAPRAGESLRIRKIHVTNPGIGTLFCLLINDTARVGFFRVAPGFYGGVHLTNPRLEEVDAAACGCNMVDWMAAQAGFTGYPVVQGEAFTLQLNAGTADFFIVADSYDAADVKSTEQNGSKSTDQLYINYGSNGAIIAADGYYKVDTQLNPIEMMAFPFGVPGAGLLPSGKKCDVLLLGGQPVGRLNGLGLSGVTNYLRAHVGAAPAQSILDRNDVGLLFQGHVPAVGADWTSTRSSIPSNPRPYAAVDSWLPKLSFQGNDEFALQVQVTVAGGAGNQLDAFDLDVWTLLHVYPAS